MASEATLPPSERGVAYTPRFAFDVFKLASGNVAGQVLAFLVAPLVARLYSPATFGGAATFAAALSIFSAIVTLRYEMAILLPQESEKAAALAWGGTLIVTMLAGLSAGAIWFLRGRSGFHLIPYMEWLPLAMFLNGITLLWRYWGIRQERFGALALSHVLSMGVAEAGRIGFGLLGQDTPLSLIVANIIGVSAGLVFLAQRVGRKTGLFVQGNVQKALAELKLYYKFPLFASWTGLLDTLSQQITPILLAMFFTNQVVGFYAQANRITITPLLLLSTAISQVFAQSAAHAQRKGTLARLTTLTARDLWRIGWYPATALFLFGPSLTKWFLGHAWEEAGHYVQILAIWMLTTLLCTPLTGLYAILERQELGLGLSLLLLGFRIAGLVIGALFGDPRLALALYAIIGSAVNLAQVGLLMHLAHASLRPLVRAAAISLAFTILLGLAIQFLPVPMERPGYAIGGTLIGGLLYGGLWIAIDTHLREMTGHIAQSLWARVRHPANAR